MLSKAEAKEIGLRIKVIEKEILTKCLRYPVFRQQLINICNQVIRNHKNAIKYTKDLSDDTDMKIIKSKVAKFKIITDIILHIGVPTHPSIQRLPELVHELNLTSSCITQMLEPLKEFYRTMVQYEQQTQQTYKFLEVKNDMEYNELVQSCEDGIFLKQLSRKLYTSEDALIKRLRQQEDVLKFYYQNELGIEEQNQIKELVVTVEKLQAKYQEDRERLIQSNLPLVISRATKFQKSGGDLEDLIQEGNIGLIKAVDKFDPNMDVKLSTYATWWIDQAIRRGIANKGRTVRVPIHVQENLKKINKTFMVLSQKLKREPTLKEIADELDMPIANLERLQTSALHEIGMDSELTSGIAYSDVIFDKEQETPFKKTSDKLLGDRVRLALSDLSERSEKIIRLRFGIGVKSDHTLEEIGQKFQITKERVRQIQSKALSKIDKNGILDFDNPKRNENDENKKD